MSVINRNSFAKLLWPGINTIFGKSYNDHPMEWKTLGFETFNDGKAYSEDVAISGFGLAQVKGEGEPITYDSAKQTYVTRYTPVVYALGFMVTREQYEDNQYALGLDSAQALARSMRHTEEIVHADVLNNAFSSSYLGGDGQPLISASHPSYSGGAAMSNRPTTYVDVSEAAFEQSVIDISKYVDDRGLKIACRIKQLVIPVDLQFEVERILMSQGRVGTADNDPNALKLMGSIPKVVTSHYLTDTDAWFLVTDCPKGLRSYQRRKMEFGTDNDWETENAKFKATIRFGPGFTDWRGVYASSGA